MKKILSFLLVYSILFSLSALCACSNNVSTPVDSDDTNKETLTVAMPDGAPVLAAFSLMAGDKKINGHGVEFNVLSSNQTIATVVGKGEADIAVMPTNVAVKLYNKGVKIKMLSVNVYGVLYMIGQKPISDMTDLYGKVVYNIGEGGTPDLALKYIFDKKGIEYVESETPVENKVALSYVKDAQTAVGNVKKDADCYGVVGEPVASNAVNKVSAKIVMDIQAEWKELTGKEFTQAGVVVTEKVYNDKILLGALFEKLSQNPAYILNNADLVKRTINECGSALEIDFTKEILGRCNLKCVSAKDAKEDLVNYFTEILKYDQTFLGGGLPDDDFYLD